MQANWNRNRTSAPAAERASAPSEWTRTRESRLARWLADWSRPAAANARWEPPLIASVERAINGARASRSELGRTRRLSVQCELERCA